MSDKPSSRRVPASPTIVRGFIMEILQSNGPMKRDELVARVRRMAPQKGFNLDGASAHSTVKKALRILADERSITSPRVGYWEIGHIADGAPTEGVLIPDSTEALPREDTSGDDADLDASELPTPVGRLKVERQIGDGPQCIYVYYHDAHAELARRDGQSAWECKIGCTVGEPDARVIGQGALTCFPRPPIIGLLIRTHDARNLEHVLHSALTIAGKRVDGGGGSEWFITSPERIEQWFDAFLKDLSFLR